MSRDRVEVLTSAGRTRIVLTGAFDIDARDGLAKAIAALPVPAGSVEIDLRGVDFIDSTGLTAVLEAHRRIRDEGAALRLLVSESGPVRRLLQLTLMHLSVDVRVV